MLYTFFFTFMYNIYMQYLPRYITPAELELRLEYQVSPTEVVSSTNQTITQHYILHQ